jgi:hypothetical protein
LLRNAVPSVASVYPTIAPAAQKMRAEVERGVASECDCAGALRVRRRLSWWVRSGPGTRTAVPDPVAGRVGDVIEARDSGVYLFHDEVRVGLLAHDFVTAVVARAWLDRYALGARTLVSDLVDAARVVGVVGADGQATDARLLAPDSMRDPPPVDAAMLALGL